MAPSVTFPLILQIKGPMYQKSAVSWYIGLHFGHFCPFSRGDVPCFCIFLVHRSCGRYFADAQNDNYASLRAPSLMTTGMTTGSWPYFSANEAFAFSTNES